MSSSNPLQIVQLTKGNNHKLLTMLERLASSNESDWFKPHPFNIEFINKIISDRISDLYYVMERNNIVIGYGILRGWDEGYIIPSLGIAIDKDFRGIGLGALLIHFLHSAARDRGSKHVRLRVSNSNVHAHNLYISMGYIFDDLINTDNNTLITGVKALR